MAISATFLSNYYSSKYSSLFSNSSSSSSNNIASIAQKYTYFKANYKDIKASLKDTTTDETKDTSDKTSTTSTKSEYTKTKLSASELKSAATALSSEDLYKKDEEGNYNTDEIVSAVKEFAESYNDLKELSAESVNDTVVKKAYYMVNTTSTFSKSLSKVGIKVNSDNTLTVDEDKLKSADMNTVKTLFSGDYSYGNTIATRANEIKSAPLTGYLSYSYDSSNNSLFESYLSSMESNSILDYFV